MCKEDRDLVYSDRQIQVEKMAQAFDILTILHDRLGMRKLTPRRVSKSFSDELIPVGLLPKTSTVTGLNYANLLY